MNQNITYQQAMVLLERAYRQQMKGNLSEAIALYKRSLAVQPTAEAYTFLGWAYSQLDQYDEAIQYCEQAIALDPDFGNPYNDIGSYLLEKGNLEEALPWLEKATTAARYDFRHFPYVNIGQLHERLGRYRSAVAAYDQAIQIDPHYLPAYWAKYALLARAN